LLESGRPVDLLIGDVEKSAFAGGAYARVTVHLTNLVTMTHLRLYRRRRDGVPFVSGVVRDFLPGQRRSPLTLSGNIQHVCTAVVRDVLHAALMDNYPDAREAPLEELWLADEDQLAHFDLRGLRRSRDVVLHTLESVDRVREDPTSSGRWLFTLRLFGGEVVVDDCEIDDLDAEFPSVVGPLVARSQRRYVDFDSSFASRIVATVRNVRDQMRPSADGA
jgi:hypothetical protein